MNLKILLIPIWKIHQVSRWWLVSFWSSEQFTGLEVETPPGMNRGKYYSIQNQVKCYSSKGPIAIKMLIIEIKLRFKLDMVIR